MFWITGRGRNPRKHARPGRLLALCLVVVACSAFAGRPRDAPGVSVPDMNLSPASGLTRVVSDPTGARLITQLNETDSWQVLNDALSRLRIAPMASDPTRKQLQTEWVLWSHDTSSGRGGSRPKSLRANYRERHRFRFTVTAEAAGRGSIVRLEDHARQQEIDITPDSEYSWLEWRDAEPQPGAAHSFLQRLQGEYEAAMSSRQVPETPSKATPAVVDIDGAAPQALDHRPQSGARALAAPTGDSAGPARKSTPTAARPGVRKTVGSLIVNGAPEATWDALIESLEALGIEIESADPRQYMLVTAWTDSAYNRDTQQFTLPSAADPVWAFSMLGGGLQRHRFQLVVVPLDSGTRSKVYAYHTGHQVQEDMAPDSSAAFLEWQDRETDPRVAAAFLNRLRVIVRR